MREIGRKWLRVRTARLRLCAILLLTATAVGVSGLLPQDEPAVSASSAGIDAKALAGLTVAIDPGHGGYDGGARAHDSGIWEKVLTLAIAERTEEALLAHGARVVLTRREDIALAPAGSATLKRKRADLQARVDIAKEAKADVLLSIHLNEYRSRRESGPQVFYQRGGDDGRLLAGALQEALVAELRPHRQRVAMAGDYYVLRSAIPSALVECGFLSNAAEERLLLDEEYQRRIANALVRGLAEYIRLRAPSTAS